MAGVGPRTALLSEERGCPVMDPAGPAHSYPATPPDTLPGAGAALGKGSPGREHRSQGHGMRTALTAAWAGRETRQHEEQV